MPWKTFLLLPVLMLAAPAQESDVTSEFWPEFDFFVKLNEKSRIFALYTATKPENLGTYADGQSGIHIDFYAVPPFRKRIVQ